MANTNCEACEELRQTDPSLIVNGLGDEECASLQNDTGLVASSGNNDCEDLNNLNDCLVNNMATEVDAYDVCDWKTFMKKFTPNLWTTLKAIICAICGIWTNIHSIWTSIQNLMDLANRIDCIVRYITTGATFYFSEYTQTTTSHIVAGKGVSFLNVSSSGTSADILLRHVSGGIGYIKGSCKFYDSSFTDGAAVYSFDNNGVNPTYSKNRSGNSVWNTNNDQPVIGGELVYEIRLKKSDYPQIQDIVNGVARPSADWGFESYIRVTHEGDYAYGQHGQCSVTTGEPSRSGADRGHLVPSGWIYIQMRIGYMHDMTASSSGKQYTPEGLLPIKINTGNIQC